MLWFVCVFWTLCCQKEWFVESTDATLYTHGLTWNDANKYCKSIGQNLVTIDKYHKSKLLLKSYSDNSYQSSVTEVWIGLHSPDPDNPGQFQWANDCSSSSYEDWEINNDSIPDKFCTYVNSYNMKWNLAPCSTVVKSFMCEQKKSICNSGFYYEVFYGIKGNGDRGTMLYWSSPKKCENNCNYIASSSFCWGFLYNIPGSRCRPYDVIDDPYYNDNNKEAHSDLNLHVRRCNYSVSLLTTPITVTPYNFCGKVLVSDCSTFLCPTTTTELQTTQEESTMTTEKQTTQSDLTTVTTIDLQTTDVVTTTKATSLHTTHEDSSTFDSQYSTSAFSQTNTGTEMTTGVTESTTYCVCACINVTSALTLEERIKEIVDYLKIDKAKTSFSIRKRTSAEDKRPFSVGIGYAGIATLISVFGFLIFLDFHFLIAKLCTLCKNISK